MENNIKIFDFLNSIKLLFMFEKGYMLKIRFLLLSFLEIAIKKTFNFDLNLGSQKWKNTTATKQQHARFLWISPHIITFNVMGIYIFYFWQLLDGKENIFSVREDSLIDSWYYL